MSDGVSIDGQGQTRDAVGFALIARESPDDVQQFFIRKADQRPSKQGAQCQRVATISKDTGDRDQILDFLTTEEPFASLGRNRDAAAFQSFFVSP